MVNDDYLAKLEEMKLAYAKKLPTQLQSLENQWAELSVKFDQDRFESFYRAVHSIGGSAGLLGYQNLSESSQELDRYLRPLLDCDTDEGCPEHEFSPEQREHVRQMLDKIIATKY